MADLLDIDGLAFVGKGGVSRDDEKRFGSRQSGNNVLDHAVGKIFLFRIDAHVVERQHRDGGLVGERERLRRLARQVCYHGRGRDWGNAHAPDPYRFGDILQRLRTCILKGDIYLATNLPVRIVGNAKAARFCDPFETHCNIDAVTKDIILCNDNITDVNADAKFDPFVLRHIGIVFGHAALDFVGTSHGVDHAPELNESAVPGILDDAPAMIADFGIKKRLSQSFQLRQRAFFVDPYQAARARNIRRQNRCQSPLYGLSAQDAPPGSGKLNVHIAQLGTNVRLCPRPKWVNRRHNMNFEARTALWVAREERCDAKCVTRLQRQLGCC
jgi:hypothetical protein